MTPPRQHLADLPVLLDRAAESAGAWNLDGPPVPSPDSSPVPSPRTSLAAQAQARWSGLRDSLAEVCDVAVSSLSDAEVREELDAVLAAGRALEARACRLTAALASRAASDARAASGTDDARAGARAARQVRAELAEQTRQNPGAVLRAQRLGDRIDGSPAVAAALDAGELTADHVHAIDRCLEHLSGDDRRFAEAELLSVAATGTPRDVHDQGVRLLARLDPVEAVERAERQHARRQGSVTRGRDGAVVVHGRFHGLQAELAMTAWHAFRRPDRPGERARTPDQRGADALAEVFRASVEGGAPATQHGVKPHVLVTVDLETVMAGTGVAETEWSGPILWDTVRGMLHDCGLTFLAIRNEIPVAVTEEVRTIPVGTFKGVQHRDGGCIRVHCDMPANWCQVAHLADPYAKGGKLTIDTCGLLCTDHHRKFDAGHLAVTWVDKRPIVHPPGEPPGDPP